MLESNEKQMIEVRVEKLLGSIRQDAEYAKGNGTKPTDIIDRVTRQTINQMTPESKMLLSSAYNMMMKHTLADPHFQSPQDKARFFEANILKRINAKFDFSIPSKIHYEEAQTTYQQLAAAGAVISVGGVISIVRSSWLPMGIATILAAIMTCVLKANSTTSAPRSDVSKIIEEYLQKVQQSFMLWIDEIERFYDEEVERLKKAG